MISNLYFDNKEELIKAIEEMKEAISRYGLSGTIESIITKVERNDGYIIIPIDSNRGIGISSMVYVYTDGSIEDLSRYSVNEDEIRISYQINGISPLEIIINKNAARITIKSKFPIKGFNQEEYPSLTDILLSINYGKKRGTNFKEYLGYIRSTVVRETNLYKILNEIKKRIEES